MPSSFISFALLCWQQDTDLSEGSQPKRYVNVKMPEDLMKEIEKLIKNKRNLATEAGQNL